MFQWLKTLCRASHWRERAKAAENRIMDLESWQPIERRRYESLCDRLLGTRLVQHDTEYALQIRFSSFEDAKGPREEIIRRYGAYVRERFEAELRQMMERP